ncbi:hypothetical protein C8R43DRAFT_1118945 [Mycena crocata]|nr:hypothetical protein C8R43DRAFT_1118945 [Mycena crocata]
MVQGVLDDLIGVLQSPDETISNAPRNLVGELDKLLPQIWVGAVRTVPTLTNQPLKEHSEVSLHIDTFICANMALAVLNVDEMRKRTMCASRVTKNGLRAVTLRVVDSLMED